MHTYKSIIFFLFIIFSFSSHAKINQPYGLFFVQDNELKEGERIFEAPTLKTDVEVVVQGLLTSTTVRHIVKKQTGKTQIEHVLSEKQIKTLDKTKYVTICSK